jgi:hypothetical protein
MRTQLIIALAAIAMCSCGGAKSNAANNSNANSSSSSNRTASTKAAETPAQVLEPTTMSATDLVGAYRKENEGRLVTVSGGQLETIGYSSIQISTISGSFTCSGDFADYQSMKTRIDDLRTKHQSPSVTVKGIYATSSYSGDRPALKSCILTDLKR